MFAYRIHVQVTLYRSICALWDWRSWPFSFFAMFTVMRHWIYVWFMAFYVMWVWMQYVLWVLTRCFMIYERKTQRTWSFLFTLIRLLIHVSSKSTLQANNKKPDMSKVQFIIKIKHRILIMRLDYSLQAAVITTLQ